MSLKSAANRLQTTFSIIDMVTERRTAFVGPELILMRLQQLKIKMYKETGHERPHIHIDYGSRNHVASYALDTGKRLSGHLHRKYDQAIGDWIAERRADLVAAWELLQAGHAAEKVLAQLQGNV